MRSGSPPVGARVAPRRQHRARRHMLVDDARHAIARVIRPARDDAVRQRPALEPAGEVPHERRLTAERVDHPRDRAFAVVLVARLVRRARDLHGHALDAVREVVAVLDGTDRARRALEPPGRVVRQGDGARRSGRGLDAVARPVGEAPAVARRRGARELAPGGVEHVVELGPVSEHAAVEPAVEPVLERLGRRVRVMHLADPPLSIEELLGRVAARRRDAREAVAERRELGHRVCRSVGRARPDSGRPSVPRREARATPRPSPRRTRRRRAGPSRSRTRTAPRLRGTSRCAGPTRRRSHTCAPGLPRLAS